MKQFGQNLTNKVVIFRLYRQEQPRQSNSAPLPLTISLHKLQLRESQTLVENDYGCVGPRGRRKWISVTRPALRQLEGEREEENLMPKKERDVYNFEQYIVLSRACSMKRMRSKNREWKGFEVCFSYLFSSSHLALITFTI